MSNNRVVKDKLDDEAIDSESVNGEQLESDSDQDTVVFFNGHQSSHSNAVGTRPVAGPSADRNKR